MPCLQMSACKSIHIRRYCYKHCLGEDLQSTDVKSHIVSTLWHYLTGYCECWPLNLHDSFIFEAIIDLSEYTCALYIPHANSTVFMGNIVCTLKFSALHYTCVLFKANLPKETGARLVDWLLLSIHWLHSTLDFLHLVLQVIQAVKC